MSPEEAKFILENDPGLGCQLAQLSLMKGEGMWKTLLECGLAKAIRKSAGVRRDLISSLGWRENTDDAVQMLTAILEDLTPKQRQTMCAATKGGSTIIGDWLQATGIYTADAKYVLNLCGMHEICDPII